MKKRFPFSMWNYPPVTDEKTDFVDDWAECGMTVPMSPSAVYGKDDLKDLIPFLDRAAEKGMQMIMNIYGLSYDDAASLGEEEYEKRFREVYELFKGHPALYGFFCGDEPGTKAAYEGTIISMKVQKRVAPELNPVINMHGSMQCENPDNLGGRTFREWLKYAAEETKCTEFGFDAYSQMINDGGINNYFEDIKALNEAAEYAGVDMWVTLLSSAHYEFRKPDEYQFMWQITTAAAAGLKGVVWFRFYDRDIAPNSHGSPIDEFGYKTEQFYRLLRCQRRFNTHNGILISSLKRKRTYTFWKDRADYPRIEDHPEEPVQVSGCEDGFISFFEDENGTEYFVIVNASQNTPGSYRVTYDNDKYKLMEQLFGGEKEDYYRSPDPSEQWGGIHLYPGQMAIYKIVKI